MSEAQIERAARFEKFLKQHNCKYNDLVVLKGDASRRRFYRYHDNNQSMIVIDANPDLGEEPIAYAAITSFLEMNRYSVPKIHASSIEDGFFIVEDFGDDLFALKIKNGADANALYKNALDLLVDLKNVKTHTVLKYNDETYKLQNYDINKLISEIKIFIDWYFPKVTKRPTPKIARDELNTIFRGLLLPVIHEAQSLVLRDYHGENMMLLEGRSKLNMLGLLDFQDAIIGNPAYDVVSLLQDARCDITPEFEKTMLDYYLSKANLADNQAFLRDYYILGAQRNIKILGIFMRLWVRDDKTQYLQHIDRIWQYLERSFAQPQLSPLKDWFDRWLPDTIRTDFKVA